MGGGDSTTAGMIPTHADSFFFTGVIVITPNCLFGGSPSSSSVISGALGTALATPGLVLAFFVGGGGETLAGVVTASDVFFAIVFVFGYVSTALLVGFYTSALLFI